MIMGFLKGGGHLKSSREILFFCIEIAETEEGGKNLVLWWFPGCEVRSDPR